jgi:hypothetical protein
MEPAGRFNPSSVRITNYKERNGFVTTWLVLGVIANGIISLIYLCGGNYINDNLPEPLSDTTLYFLAAFGLVNVICYILLLNWKVIGFWGIFFSNIIVFIINLYAGVDPVTSFLSMGSFGALAGILQIRKEGVSAWNNLR